METVPKKSIVPVQSVSPLRVPQYHKSSSSQVSYLLSWLFLRCFCMHHCLNFHSVINKYIIFESALLLPYFISYQGHSWA